MSDILDQELGSVLAVGLREAGNGFGSRACTFADNARSAIELLRVLRFDLVVTSDRLPDMPAFQFVRRMRTAWPWQKWALVSGRLSIQDEITARTLGVMQIIEGSVDWDAVAHLAGVLHEQHEARRFAPSAAVRLLKPASTT